MTNCLHTHVYNRICKHMLYYNNSIALRLGFNFITFCLYCLLSWIFEHEYSWAYHMPDEIWFWSWPIAIIFCIILTFFRALYLLKPYFSLGVCYQLIANLSIVSFFYCIRVHGVFTVFLHVSGWYLDETICHSITSYSDI